MHNMICVIGVYSREIINIILASQMSGIVGNMFDDLDLILRLQVWQSHKLQIVFRFFLSQILLDSCPV